MDTMVIYKVPNDELYHHGVKGMKWGVRRYQYADGSLTPAGKKRYSNTSSKNTSETASSSVRAKANYVVDYVKTAITGKQYVDTYIKSGTTFSRIQSYDTFESHAFYATYKKQDVAKYMGLFGNNLQSRAAYEAKRAEKLAKKTGDETDILNAKELRSKSDNLKVYQIKIEATQKLKIPSDENASDITANLLKDSEFKSNLEASISDSKTKMRRPAQQLLFDQAQKALEKEPQKMSSSEKQAVYKAFNLSLTNHNEQEIAAQDRFYTELKKKGYNALLDYNDKEYSSYHAKRPMIVFDMDSVKLQSVTETNPKVVNKLYKHYNKERIIKEIPANTVGIVNAYAQKTVSDCTSYVNRKVNEYAS